MSKERFLLVLWLTGRCNLNCSYCYASKNPAKKDMDFSTAKQAIDRLRNHPLKIQFAGGEPLLNFSLAEQVCRYVQEEGIDAQFSLQTNGTLCDDIIARKLHDLHISTGVSLDGVPKINELTRGKTLAAVNGIRALGRQGMMVGINAVVTAKNVEHLTELVDFAFYLGNVGGIGLDLLRHAGRGAENQQKLDITPEQLRRALFSMNQRSQELFCLSGRKVQIREVELAKKRLSGLGQNRHYCYASCGRSAVVLPNGKTYPCGSLISEDYCMGRVEDICPGSLLHLETKISDSCKACPYEGYCPKGCPSRKINNIQDLDCVLLKTAFILAEREQNENEHQHDSCGFGYEQIC